MALVVFVFATVLMLSTGLEQTLVTTGSDNNVLVIRQSSETEVQSSITREQAALLAGLPEIARDAKGQRLVSKEVVVLMVLPKRGTAKPANVTIRGLSGTGLQLRPQVRIIQGRAFRPGSSEIIAGSKIATGFAGTGIGERLRFGQRGWTVVGIFEAGGTGFSSEIWGDADQLLQAFRRPAYSSILFQLAEPAAFATVQKKIAGDQRLPLEAKRETQFYAEQSELLANFLRILGLVLSGIFASGAIIGAMITMYASVASRTAEIGTLRALGFTRGSILWAFLAESMLLGLVGGAAGLAAASSLQFLTISTMNWQTFSELAFRFTVTAGIVGQALAFALLMGFIGGVLPAVRAARMNIVEALRTV
jgi:ABC-type antimicrobial peptide transport system permease subunit